VGRTGKQKYSNIPSVEMFSFPEIFPDLSHCARWGNSFAHKAAVETFLSQIHAHSFPKYTHRFPGIFPHSQRGENIPSMLVSFVESFAC